MPDREEQRERENEPFPTKPQSHRVWQWLLANRIRGRRVKIV